jgi:hypothetical protein
MLAQRPRCANPTDRPPTPIEQHSLSCENSSPRPAPSIGADVKSFTPARYNFNNSRSRFVCARDTGISDCRLSFIFSM